MRCSEEQRGGVSATYLVGWNHTDLDQLIGNGGVHAVSIRRDLFGLAGNQHGDDRAKCFLHGREADQPRRCPCRGPRMRPRSRGSLLVAPSRAELSTPGRMAAPS
jgi:hypothetical protein